MKSALFIKTCVQDFIWLEWCLASIDKYATFDEYVIAIGISDFDKVPKELMREPYKWIKVEDDLDRGYLNQQMIKHHADLFTESDYIVFMDSDCVFTAETSLETYMRLGRPIVPYTPYASLGDQVPWKRIVEKALGFTVEYEYMRRHPLVFKSTTVRDMRRWFESKQGTTLARYIVNQPNKEYSEFNVLGSWAYRYEREKYHFMNTEDDPEIPCNVRQFWSYGGFNEEIVKELREICN